MTALWVLWLIYVLALIVDLLYVQPYRSRRARAQGLYYSAGSISFGLRAALPVFTLVLLLRTFVADVYHIPSQSMHPALEEGSRIWVNRLAYGLRSPLSGDLWLRRDPPARGEVIVFQYPREPRTTYVKRVLAVPGDRVLIDGDEILLNGQPLTTAPADHDAFRPVSLGDAEYRLYDDPTVASSLQLALDVPENH